MINILNGKIFQSAREKFAKITNRKRGEPPIRLRIGQNNYRGEKFAKIPLIDSVNWRYSDMNRIKKKKIKFLIGDATENFENQQQSIM
jgi:hypothetical protein